MADPLRYLSVCSGIEAATVAWHPLGWRPVAFSEIDRLPCAVLAHRYGSNMPCEPLAKNGVPNLGDMTRHEEWPDFAIDLLVGGTPCQDYSIAGKREGMAGSRGALTLTFLEIAARYRPAWIVWENVPGVLSSNGGRDFATFLRDLGQLGYGWAYRVLDAQYVRTRDRPGAVPQRRQRVFVVGYLGDWRPPAAVFFDAESLSGHPPPRRQSVQGIAARAAAGAGIGGELCANSGDVGYCLTASSQQSLDAETETLIAVAHTLRAEGHDASEDGTGRGVPIVPYAIQERAVSENPDAGPQGKGWQDGVGYTLEARHHVQAVATEWTVRRLTPRECERLQGFPDDYTLVPHTHGKPAADGPRYKALGNSMAVNVMEWIGRRIELVREEMAAADQWGGWADRAALAVNETPPGERQAGLMRTSEGQ
jgi:DNA (cytosine-5)-methyltransferase 1